MTDVGWGIIWSKLQESLSKSKVEAQRRAGKTEGGHGLISRTLLAKGWAPLFTAGAGREQKCIPSQRITMGAHSGWSH